MPLTGVFHVTAATYYPLACSASEFEVSYINDDGSFSKISCHSSFSEAKSMMKTDRNYVVRYSKSYSPTKIVAMNTGLAYTYPGRRNSSTMNIIQNPSDRNSTLYKTSYISNHYEMRYIKTCGTSTYDIAPAGKGYIRVNVNGFEGYTDLEYTDLVPSKYLENNIPIWLGGNNVYENEGPFKVKVYQNYYMIENNGKYTDLVFHFYRAYPKGGVDGNDALSYQYSVDNAKNYLDAGMKKGVKYYSDDGINFYSDPDMTKLVCTCYGYYQFLPLRTRTDISSGSIDAFMKSMKGNSSVMSNKASSFINAQEKYGCNALLVYAMACLESAYGTSGYATNRNNLFGWSAYDDSPNDASYFSSVDVCVNEQMGRNLNWFMDYTNRRYFGNCVGNKGAGLNVQYASDPYWGIKIAAIAYNIDKFANNNNGKLTDHNKYTIGLLKGNYNDVLYSSSIEWDANIYRNATGKDVLYTGRYGSHYQKDLTFALIGKTDSRYKVQTTNPISNGRLVTEDGVLKYDWEASVGYVDIDDITILNNNSSSVDPIDVPADDPTYNPIISLREITLNNNTVSINGIGAIHGLNFDDVNKIKHTINFVDIKNNETIYTIDAQSIDSDSFDNDDGYNYQYAGFNVTVDLNDENLIEGSYYIELVITNDNKTAKSYLYSSDKEYRNMGTKSDNRSYLFRMNDNLDYRFEVDILEVPDAINVTSINKPSARPSLESLDSMSIDDNGILEIKAHGYMHYLDYENVNKIIFDMYLVDDVDNYIKLDTDLYDDGINYTSELNSKYKLNHISFMGTADLKKLNSGRYQLYLVMSNDKYVDILEMTNYGLELDSVSLDGTDYVLETSKIRNRIELNISGGN